MQNLFYFFTRIMWRCLIVCNIIINFSDRDDSFKKKGETGNGRHNKNRQHNVYILFLSYFFLLNIYFYKFIRDIHKM